MFGLGKMKRLFILWWGFKCFLFMYIFSQTKILEVLYQNITDEWRYDTQN